MYIYKLKDDLFEDKYHVYTIFDREIKGDPSVIFNRDNISWWIHKDDETWVIDAIQNCIE